MTYVDRIVRLKVELDDWQPSIWRRVEVPLTATLRAVHDVIQAVMPFRGYHLFEFRADGQRFAIPNPEWDGLRDKTNFAKAMKLGGLSDRGIAEFGYTYDFGDDWRHTITVEATAAADPAMDYPRYLEGAGRAPPEDVGGIPGFELFLDAIADPDHEQHMSSCAGMAVPSIRPTLTKTPSAPVSQSSPAVAPWARLPSRRAGGESIEPPGVGFAGGMVLRDRSHVD
ncbi:hypothetical protein J2X65_004898 [Ancylobacter sp. 3268]|uniref:plasmid pRiA4b ORF-3 family protein n=1 Tax=Ancylobacter sp. 3268 TaxID=2817752 RepID=UPI00285B19C5|nr:plasmid pRiA4b ORF-3 family protein [Ancylobacter sp. 3268]MDR6955518.1 hypothetical protein [Ancylobacter sp. 3268]